MLFSEVCDIFLNHLFSGTFYRSKKKKLYIDNKRRLEIYILFSYNNYMQKILNNLKIFRIIFFYKKFNISF